MQNWMSAKMARPVTGLFTITGLMVLVAVVVFASGFGGCQSAGPLIAACPWPSPVQSAEILKLAPLGTPRSEVLEKLKSAGISGNSGANESIFYCDLWKQPSGEVWHINVVLLFDADDQLYATRPAVAATDETVKS
jgi:hypothetical protein